MKYAKKFCRTILESLRDGDLFGCISYSAYARVIFPLQPLSGGAWRTAAAAVESLGDETHSNFQEALKMTAEQFARFRSQQASGRQVYVFTRTRPDKGETDAGALADYAVRMARENDLAISFFGIDRFFDETLCEAIADSTGGKYHYADFFENPDEILFHAAGEIERLTRAAARGVSVEILPPAGVTVTNVEGGRYENRRILVGDMRPGRTQMVAFDLANRPKRQRECEIMVYYRDTDGITERDMRHFFDIPLIESESRFNPDMAPRLIVYDLQASLAETMPHLPGNRQHYASVLRANCYDIEQENVLLNSEYIRDALIRLRRLEQNIQNTSIENERLAKQIRYQARQLLLDN